MNAEIDHDQTILDRLCLMHYKAVEMRKPNLELIKLLLNDERCNFLNNAIFYAINYNHSYDRIQLVKEFLHHPRFDVNKKYTEQTILAVLSLYFGRADVLEEQFSILKLLCNHGADLNQFSPIGYSPLLHYLITEKGRNYNPSKRKVDVLKYMFEKGLSPDIDKCALHFAAVVSSNRVFKLIVQHSRDVNKSYKWEIDDLIIPKCELMDKYMELYNSGGETPLHVAARIASKQKMNMLILKGGDLNAKWNGDSVNKTLEKYAVLHKTIDTIDHESCINQVKCCRHFMRKTETKDIFSAVSGVVYKITDQLSRHFNVSIECILTGSVSENTKCFSADEFDFLLKVKLPRETLCYFSHSVYLLIDALFKFQDPYIMSDDHRLKSISFLLETKISKLHLKWTGPEFKNMDILVDVSVCSHKQIAKFSRYEKCAKFGNQLHR